MQRHTARACRSTSAGQPSVASFFTTEKNIPRRTKSEVTEKCVRFCCKDIRPFYVVHGDGFVELAQELINVGAAHGKVPARSVLPNHSTVSNKCREMAEEKRKGLADKISDRLKSGTVAMTTDMWTDDYRKLSYLAITCHFIGEDFELVGRNLTTAMFPMEDAKTGENIRREIVKLLVTKFGLDSAFLRKIVWVTDQGSNILLALRPYQRLDCQDHIYNTVLRHALDVTALTTDALDVAETLTAAKSLVRYVKQSGLAAQLSKTVLQMGETRFSTVYLTLNSVQGVYHELHEKLEARGEAARIENIAPDTLGFLVDLLKPFYEAQRELEGDKYPTLNLVCLWFERLKRHCQSQALDSPQQAAVRSRLSDWLPRKVLIHDLHKVATFLWPKFNQLRMLSAQDRDHVYSHVRSLLRDMTASSPEEDATEGDEDAMPPLAKRSALDFTEWENMPSGIGEEEEDEVTIYTSQRPVMQDERDLLGWWRRNSAMYPRLSKLARDVLCIPASSSSSERTFSVAGRTISQRRTQLKPATVDAILFLHDNM